MVTKRATTPSTRPNHKVAIAFVNATVDDQPPKNTKDILSRRTFGGLEASRHGVAQKWPWQAARLRGKNLLEAPLDTRIYGRRRVVCALAAWSTAWGAGTKGDRHGGLRSIVQVYVYQG